MALRFNPAMGRELRKGVWIPALALLLAWGGCSSRNPADRPLDRLAEGADSGAPAIHPDARTPPGPDAMTVDIGAADSAPPDSGAGDSAITDAGDAEEAGLSDSPPPDDLAPPPGDLPFAGHWMRDVIGDCIQAEEWFSFRPGNPFGFTFTMVDRNACSANWFVKPVEGTGGFQSGALIQIRYENNGVQMAAEWTPVVVNGWWDKQPPHPFGYQPGGRALNVRGFVAAPDGGGKSFRNRYSQRMEYPENGYFSWEETEIRLLFDRPVSAGAGSCKISASVLVARNSTREPLEKDEKKLEFGCTAGPSVRPGFQQIVFDGFEPSTAFIKWNEYITRQKLFAKEYSPLRYQFERALQPVLYFRTDNASSLFVEGDGWLTEYRDGPPATVTAPARP
ncbi:MAG: hypothetical protein GMKNLPBB_02180 [Myxococcota bacterium]|nr:hypothetical protein [Myxococcota bacterium]